MKKIFSSCEVGKLIGADPSSVNRWIDSGKLVAFRTPGGHRRVLRAELVTFLKELGMPLPPELRSTPVALLIGEFTPAAKKAVKQIEMESTFEKNLTQGLLDIGKIKPDVVVLRNGASGVSEEIKRCMPSIKVVSVPTSAKPAEIVSAMQS
jgi:excisionase family DNA binding protein